MMLERLNKIPKASLPLTAYLDYVGITGLTAYFAMFNVPQVKKEDVVVISGWAKQVKINVHENSFSVIDFSGAG